MFRRYDGMNKKKISKTDIVLVIIVVIGLLYYLYMKGYIFANFKNITPKEAYQILKKRGNEVILIDVRTPQEYQQDGRIKGAILIPLDKLGEKVEDLKEYKNSKTLIVYCRSGNRSVIASRFLSNLGFKVYNIKGGINAWKSEGLPIER